MLVSICIITYKRPKGLKRLLEGIDRLVFNVISPPEIEVIVVDNDVDGVAREICAAIKSNFRWTLKTDVETNRGISYARNKSLSLASPKADFIAMLDDDEAPQSQWLEELILVQQEYQGDIVAGPVDPLFPPNTPNWIIKGKFFHQTCFPNGETRDMAFTNNVLIKGEILRKLDKVFDNRFALTGGEDSELFMRIKSLNYKIVWAERAIVEEWISPSRINLSWLLKSGYRCWSTYSLLEKEFNPSLTVQIRRMLKGFALIVLGFIKLIPAAIAGKYMVVDSLLSIFRGTGTIAGLLGIKNFPMYQKPSHFAE